MPDNERAEQIIRQYSKVTERRYVFDNHWQDIKKVVWPNSLDIIERGVPGRKMMQNVFDNTAPAALEKFAAIMMALLTPQNQMWHHIRASLHELNRVPRVKEWFESANRTINQMRNSSRAAYYTNKHEGYKSLGAYGNDCLFLDERPEGGFRYKFCHVAQVHIEVDHRNIPDTIYYKFPMSAYAAKLKWGNKISEKMKTVMDEDPFKRFDILHYVAPRKGRDPQRRDFRGMKFQSLYIVLDEKHLIEEGGFHENPYMFSRYTVNPDEMYGRSPAMYALPTIRMVNEMQKVFIRSGHKAVDPPILTQHDGVLGQGARRIRLWPGAVNYGTVNSAGQELMKPFHTGARLDLTADMVNAEREVIKDAFLVTLFQILVDRPQQTATEALIRAQEKGQLLMPTIGRQQSEMLGPQIERELNIAQRQGLLEPMPPELIEAEGEYEIEYDTPAVQFQRSGELVAIQQVVETVRPFAESDPEFFSEVFVPEEVARIAVEARNAPLAILRPPEELAERREQAAQAQQQAEQMELIKGGATAIRDASQAVGGGPSRAA